MHLLLAVTGLPELIFSLCAVMAILAFAVPGVTLWLTRRENRAAAWFVLAWQLVPLGLIAALFAVVSDLFNELSPFTLVPVLLAASVALFGWLAISRLLGRAVAEAKPAVEAIAGSGPVTIPRLIPLWIAVDVAGGLAFLAVTSLLSSGTLTGSAMEVADTLVAAGIACGVWALLRRAGVGPVWIVATAVSDIAAMQLARQLLKIGTTAFGAASALLLYRLVLWPLVSGGLSGAAQLFCIPERFALRTRWPLARIGAAFAGSLLWFAASKVLPPVELPFFSPATAALQGALCAMAMKAILGAAKTAQREMTLEELTGVTK